MGLSQSFSNLNVSGPGGNSGSNTNLSQSANAINFAAFNQPNFMVTIIFINRFYILLLTWLDISRKPPIDLNRHSFLLP